MSWRDLRIILTTFGSPEEKQWIWQEAHKHADQLHAENPNDVEPTVQAVPDQDTKWEDNTKDIVLIG